MQRIQKPWIKLMESLNPEDCQIIKALEKLCLAQDKTALKLELDYKLAMACEGGSKGGIAHINEFLYFDGDKLIGYIGIGCFGGEGSTPEVMGMVHPGYREQGVFTTLFQLMTEDLKRRKAKSALLLSDGKASAGLRFIQKTGAKKHHSEFEMYLQHEEAMLGWPDLNITFRKATNADALEIARQNAIYFGDEFKAPEGKSDADEEKAREAGLILPEVEEKRGMTIYLACLDNAIIGKVHLQLTGGLGGIYGLGVLPEYRGRGFGRAILLNGIMKLKESGAGEVMLQVVTENANALHLYQSCGFDVTSTMEYFELMM